MDKISDFKPYMHIERFGRPEVEGIDEGDCLVFPKLDGTNASVWLADGEVQAGSRRRHLTPTDDNHGFAAWAKFEASAAPVRRLLQTWPNLRLFGEWLVPHTFKGYRDDAWRRFYIFDVYDHIAEQFLPYGDYVEWCENYEADYIPCMAKVHFGSEQTFWNLTTTNDYLCKPGAGPGEGIVIKRPDFVNRFGRTVWAKMVRSEFKERNFKEFGVPVVKGCDRVEEKIVDECVTQTLVDKERAKIEAALGILNEQDKPIQPRLLQTIFYCVVTEELWPILKKLKNPTIDFKLLRRFCEQRTKKFAEDLF